MGKSNKTEETTIELDNTTLPTNLNLGLAVGLALGISTVAIIIVVAAFLFNRRTRAKQKLQRQRSILSGPYEEIGPAVPYRPSPNRTIEENSSPMEQVQPLPQQNVDIVYIQPETEPGQDTRKLPDEQEIKENVYLPPFQAPTDYEHNYLDLNKKNSGLDLRREEVSFSRLGSPPSKSDAEEYPCLYAVNPGMRNLEDRLKTFSGAAGWPAWKLNATPQDFAMAGMFYLGSEDRTACWYCGGNLASWTKDDDPWEEHARWYPNCEFILKAKSRVYVEKVIEKYRSTAC